VTPMASVPALPADGCTRHCVLHHKRRTFSQVVVALGHHRDGECALEARSPPQIQLGRVKISGRQSEVLLPMTDGVTYRSSTGVTFLAVMTKYCELDTGIDEFEYAQS
jgi:hypothetical protein